VVPFGTVLRPRGRPDRPSASGPTARRAGKSHCHRHLVLLVVANYRQLPLPSAKPARHQACPVHSHMLLARQSAHGANKLSDLASPGNRLGAIAPVFQGVLVTPRSTLQFAAVHLATAVRHRRLPARLSGCPAVRPTSRTDVHRMASTDLIQQRSDECRRLAAAARNASDKAFWLALVDHGEIGQRDGPRCGRDPQALAHQRPPLGGCGAVSFREECILAEAPGFTPPLPGRQERC
jgi:hypothetical protein